MTQPDDTVTASLLPNERLLLKEPALCGGFGLTHRDLLILTDRRVFVILGGKKGSKLADTWNLEDLPPVSYQLRSGRATTLVVGSSKMELKSWNADNVAQALERAKSTRLQEMQATRPAPRALSPTIVREVHEKEIIREIVKVPCRYCNQLNLMNSAKCTGCGAPLG